MGPYGPYLKDFLQKFTELSVRSIQEIAQYSVYKPDVTFSEALTQLRFLRAKCSRFVVTETVRTVVERAKQYIAPSKSESLHPLTIWGKSGSGKTSVAAYPKQQLMGF